MKKALIIVAALAVCLVSCKNNKNNQPTTDEVEVVKEALADSLLAEIDAIAEQFDNASMKVFSSKMVLTDKEKMVKPDYLLDPAEADKFVTKTQKVNALAIYVSEMQLRKAYGMPTDDVMAAIAKLEVDINHPTDIEFMTSDASRSEKIKKEYEICKERDEIDYFWKFQYAIQCETGFLLAKNPDLFFSKMNDEDVALFGRQCKSVEKVIAYLAPYDEEMNNIYVMECERFNGQPEDEIGSFLTDVATAKEAYKSNKYHFVEWRDALLK